MDEENSISVPFDEFPNPRGDEIAQLRERVQRLVDLGRERWEGSKLKDATNVYYDCVRICCAAIMFSKTEADRKFFLDRLEVAAKQLPHVSEYWHKASGAMQRAEEFYGAGKLRNALRLAEVASDLNDAYSGRRRHIQGVNDLHFKRQSLLEHEGVRLIASPHWAALESSEPEERVTVEGESVGEVAPDAPPVRSRVVLWLVILFLFAASALVAAKIFHWI
ncbi:MAG: hypothetical protein KBG84_15370 [Planctomycetes bacterium]|nr:hypothetical protein [Planctomycetota bacterium]